MGGHKLATKKFAKGKAKSFCLQFSPLFPLPGCEPQGLETPGARDPRVLGLEGAWDPGQSLTHNV